MFELMDLGSALPSIPGIGIRVSDLHIDVEPFRCFSASNHSHRRQTGNPFSLVRNQKL